MATLMTVSEVREAVETGVSDTIMEIWLDAAEEDIIRFAGANGVAQVYSKPVEPRISYLLLPRRAVSVELVQVEGQDVATADWELEHGGLSVRLWLRSSYLWSISRYARYNWDVTIYYTAVDDTNQRKAALIQLVRMQSQHDGLASERVGDYSRSSADYAKERRRILGALRTASGRIV